MKLAPATDRRRESRTAVVRPVKVRCVATGRYYSGRTTNLSAGGALLEIDHPARLTLGQTLFLGIAWTRHDMVLSADQLIEAQVVRSLGIDRVHHVAVRFAQRAALAASA